jgi:hypothetical protein
MPFYVYILRMNDGRLYVGHSNNPPRRHAEHEHGKGCRTTGISVRARSSTSKNTPTALPPPLANAKSRGGPAPRSWHLPRVISPASTS